MKATVMDQEDDPDTPKSGRSLVSQMTNYSVPAFVRLQNRDILVVIKGFKPDSQPVWMLDQTSAYLPEFCELRAKHGVLQICHDPELASEATLMPLRRFQFDAAIIFSHMTVVPQALGMEVVTDDSQPSLACPLTLHDVAGLQVKGVVERLKYVGQAITLARRKLNGEAALFGFSEAPWTLMTYMIEGSDSETYAVAKRWLYAHKMEARRLLAVLSEVVADYCVMQAKAGAQVIQLFDTNAGFLSKDAYTEFCMPGLKIIRQRVREQMRDYDLEVPMAIFPKGLTHTYEEFLAAGFDVIGLDYCTEPTHVRNALPKRVCLQGNLDPCALYAPPQKIRRQVYAMLKKFEGTSVIANLGHGVYPDTPLQGVHAFVEAVKSFSMPFSESDHSASEVSANDIVVEAPTDALADDGDSC